MDCRLESFFSAIFNDDITTVNLYLSEGLYVDAKDKVVRLFRPVVLRGAS